MTAYALEQECIGHKQIKEGRFPFIVKDDGIYIDMEMQGRDHGEKVIDELKITWCPVCRKGLWIQ